ncbi:MAG: TrkA family potassium uptake protein [Buchananella hordeovulneris]|nr:TrkA family potassium uptake protein [Buchananella hordeovulneris]
MHIVIVGAGRVGTAIATRLENQGHSVAIIDRSPEAFERLPVSFEGRRITGMGFDRDTLIRAGIEQAYGLAAVTSGDNSNILAARVARETFGVQQVVARIYDPRRAELYTKLGIPTVGTVRWTTERMIHQLLPADLSVLHQDHSGEISLCNPIVHSAWIGTSLTEIEQRSGGRVAYFTRAAVTRLPHATDVHQEGDDVFLLVPTSQIDRATRVLGGPPQED